MLSKVCGDDARLAAIATEFERAVGLWGTGDRSAETCEVLAKGKVLSDNCRTGRDEVPRPIDVTPDEWHETLSVLVDAHLGDCRCLNCWNYFDSSKAPRNRLAMPICLHCGSSLWEPIGPDPVDYDA